MAHDATLQLINEALNHAVRSRAENPLLHMARVLRSGRQAQLAVESRARAKQEAEAAAQGIGDGDEAAPGITGMAAFGHTPGHMIYMIESGGSQLVITADTANHYVWSLAYPDWEVRFDMDKAAAAATRRRVLDMLAADKIPFIGYHMPFPAMGYVDTRDDGFRYVPVSYQMML